MAVWTEGGRFDADCVVLAAGNFTPDLLATTGSPVTIPVVDKPGLLVHTEPLPRGTVRTIVVSLNRKHRHQLDPTTPCILTELMFGSLDQLLWMGGKQASIAPTLKPRQQIKIAAGVAGGVAFLHKNRVSHRDLKSPNCLYNKDLTVKLCDFAFSKWKQAGADVMSSSVGTP